MVRWGGTQTSPRLSSPNPAAGAHHDHGHADARSLAPGRKKVLGLVMLIGLVVTGIEVVAAFAANSLVLFADATHYATDLLGVGLAFAAITLATRPASTRKTFGYQRAEVIAALFNAIALWGISAFLAYQAIQRIRAPPEVGGPLVAAIGAFTLVGNAVMAWMLHRSAGHNLNMRAAYLHVLSDVLGSAAALTAGGLIWGFGWNVADPLLTLFVTVLIVTFTWRLTSQTLHILLEGTPEHIDPDEVMASLRAIPSVTDVHDLHVWSLTSGADSLSVHVVVDAADADERVIREVHRRLLDDFLIHHATVQIESGSECPSRPCPPT